MDYVFLMVSLISVYAVLASSLNLITGYGGLISVAHAALFGVGAYAFAIASLNFGLPVVPALLFAFLAAAVASFAVSGPSLRLSGDYLLLATFAVQILASTLFLNLDITGGPAGIRGIPGIHLPGLDLGYGPSTMIGCVVVVGIALAIISNIGNSPFGTVLKAIRDDELAAASIGKNVVGFKVAVFAIGSGFAGLAGGLYALVLSFISPDSFTVYTSFTIIIMVLAGGLANPLGGLLGAAVLTGLQEVLRYLFPSAVGTQLAQIVFGLTLVAIVMWRPQGLLSEYRPDDRKQLAESHAKRGRSIPKLRTTAPTSSAAKDRTELLAVRDVGKTYGGLSALRGASLDISQGEIVGIVGPNGAGKTTLFDILAGAVRPDNGQVLLRGQEVRGLPAYRRARLGIGRLFQDARPLENMSVLDNVLVSFPNIRRENPLLSWLPLDRKAEADRRLQALTYLEYIGLAANEGQRAGKLSFGQQKLLGFARLLAQGATLWLLDEPAAGVDPVMRQSISDVILRVRVELGITVIVVEHNLEFLENIVDRIVFMADGRILREGSFAAVTKDPELSRLYLGA
jgi:branched-chain amino acid transport system permease protein